MVSLFDLLRFEVWLIAVVSMRGVLLNIIHEWILWLVARIKNTIIYHAIVRHRIAGIIACRTNARQAGVRKKEMDKNSFMNVLRRRRRQDSDSSQQTQNPHWIRFEDTNTSTSAKQDHS